MGYSDKQGVILKKIISIVALLMLFCIYPFNVWSDATRWVEVGPGGGGALRDFAFDPQDYNRIYLTSDTVGVFVSDDAGDTWRWSSYGASNQKGGIAVDPRDPRLLYIVGPDGIYRSTDRAKSWQMVYSKGNGYKGVNNQRMTALKDSVFGVPGQTISISRTGAVYVGTVVGDIIMSFDRGQNWKRVSTGSKSEVRTVIPIDDNRVIAALYDDGIYLSKDHGISWEKVLSSKGEKLLALSIHPAKNTLYALVGRPSVFSYSPRYSVRSFPASLYLSNNGGETWKRVHIFRDLVIRKGRKLMDVSKKGTIIILSEKGPIRSENGGKTWSPTRLQSLRDDGYIYATKGKWSGQKMSIYADDRRQDRWYMTGLGAALRSDDDGRTWHYKVKGLREQGYWFVKVNPKNPDIIIASDLDHGLIRSTDGGRTWQDIVIKSPYEECDELRFSPNDNTYKTLYAFFTLFSPYIVKSTDAGETWKEIKHWQNKEKRSMLRFVLTKGKSFPIMYVGEPGVGIWRSIDEGKSWELKNRGLPAPEEISLIQFLESDSRGRLYAGIVTRTRGRGGIFKSEDSGETWYPVNQGLPSSRFVRRRSFAIDPSNPDILWVGVGRGVYKSENGGKIWKQKIGGIYASAILIEPGNSDNVYVASFTGGGIMEQYTAGIYKSIDGGNYFFKISGDLFRTIGSSYRVYDLEYGWKGVGHIWAAPSAGGLIYTTP